MRRMLTFLLVTMLSSFLFISFEAGATSIIILPRMPIEALFDISPMGSIDSGDSTGINEAKQVARGTISRNNWFKRNVKKGGGTCVAGANDLASTLCEASKSPGSPLAGWRFRTITAIPPVHAAVLITSPITGKHYFLDVWFGHLDLAEMTQVGADRWVAAPGHELTFFHFFFLPLSLPVWGNADDISNCLPSASRDPDKCLFPDERHSRPIQAAGSMDPNEKVGSRGFGANRYISGEEPLRYAIFFENIEIATAAAQEVLVTEQLDMNKSDLDTFSLESIAFGDKNVVPPPGLSEFTTDVDLRPDKNLIVRIDVRLNKSTGVVEWRFTSIDPDTGGLPDDPLAGFLPPNVAPPEGEGSVMFTVMPKDGLATGTEIRNNATIVFDVNPPINTNEWLNTIDNSKPESHVLPLSATQELPEFLVEWTGDGDEGSGINDYTIFVSENGGPFTPWLTNTPDTSEIFTGQPGKTYAFYSIARDNTGNLEDALTDPDATTQVKSACQCADDNTPPTGCISGTVKNHAGQPLKGKTVILRPRRRIPGFKHMKAVTDNNGCYIFGDLRDERYSIGVIKQCRPSRQTVKIFMGEKKNDVNFECR